MMKHFTQNEVVDILQRLIEDYGMSKTSIAENMGMSRNAVNDVLTGKVTYVSDNFLKKGNRFINHIIIDVFDRYDS